MRTMRALEEVKLNFTDSRLRGRMKKAGLRKGCYRVDSRRKGNIALRI